jgi:transposase
LRNQWKQVPIENKADSPHEKEISFQAVYYHFRKWSKDGSLEQVFTVSVLLIKDDMNLSELNLDGTHTIAKKGGEAVAYQGRKKAKTSNILPVLDKKGYVIAKTGIIAGNHHDAFELEKNLKQLFAFIRRLGLCIAGAHFNSDSAFDTQKARKLCWNRGVKPNIYENPFRLRNQKPKRGRKRYFNPEVYKNRFVAERTFSWVDKFKRLLVRFERKTIYFAGFHCIVPTCRDDD